MKFELKRLSDYSDSSLIDELKRVNSIINSPKLTQREFQKLSRVHISTLRNRFGSWENALKVAGLEEKYGGKEITEKMKTQSAKYMSNDDIIQEIQRIAKMLNTTKLYVEDMKHSNISAAVLRGRFGSWGKALLAAGLSVSKTGQRFSDDECFENLFEVWTHYGRPPQYKEMGQLPSIIGGKAYVIRWKTWTKSLEAFVNYVNKSELSDTSQNPALPGNTKTSEIRNKPSKEKHGIPLGLRWKVFSRDHFKCVLCGASPATYTTKQLHADHIIPFSKGGLTVIENLQTLCRECNLGKGNNQ